MRWRMRGVTVAVAVIGIGCGTPPGRGGPHTTLVEDWRDEIIYQVLIDRFANGDVNNDYGVEPDAPGRYHGGDWQGLVDHLDYLEALGVTAIWLSPVYRNVEEDAGFASYHGYWPQDFGSVNPHFGDLAKLREVVQIIHSHGLKVIIDVVVNHIGQLFFYDINGNGRPDDTLFGGGDRSPLTRITEYDPDYDPRGIQAWTSLGESGPAHVVWIEEPAINRMPPLPPELQNADWYHRRGRVTDWNVGEQVLFGDFPGGLKDVATEVPGVRDVMSDVHARWIEDVGFDGMRIDTLKHVEHEFWQAFCAEIRRRAAAAGKERFFIFGEAFDGDDALLGSFTRPGEVDGVFYFSQKFQVFDDVFKRGQPTRRIETLFTERARNYSAVPQEGGVGVPPRDVLVNFIDNHDIPRFRYERPAIEALHNALFFLFTWDGIPSLYYGTEQELDGGNDPANREDLWASRHGAYDTTNATFRRIAALTRLRRAYPALRRGEVTIRWSSERTGGERDAGVFAFERTVAGERVLVVLNVHDGHESETRAPDEHGAGAMVTGFPAGTVLIDVATDAAGGERFTVEGGGRLVVRVPARGGRVLVPEGQVR